LFNVALEKIVRDSGVETAGTVFRKSSQLLAYADDIDIMARTLSCMTDNFVKLEDAANSMGLKINASKTKYMMARKGPLSNVMGANAPIPVGAHQIETVDAFTYLGSLITADNNTSAEIKARLAAGNRCYYGLLRHLRSRLISRKTKVLIYKTLIRPVLTYASESWTLTKKDENTLLVFERKILRKIFGPTCDRGRWRIRYNHELQALYAEPNIVQFIKIQRLQWLGHVCRMEDNRVPKRVLNSSPEGRRSRGRPKLRWLDDVEGDMRAVNIVNWRSLTADRDGWRRCLEEARAHTGL
jgi:hypothetical protein